MALFDTFHEKLGTLAPSWRLLLEDPYYLEDPVGFIVWAEAGFLKHQQYVGIYYYWCLFKVIFCGF